jgi:hypothetical protein
MKKFLKKFHNLSAVLVLLLVGASLPLIAQNPLQVIDAVKNAESWTEIFGLYEMIYVVVTLVLTQLSKFVPVIKDVSGPWKAVIVTIIVVVAGALRFGATSLGTPVVIWALVTLIYDKLVKPKSA